MGTIIKRKWKV